MNFITIEGLVSAFQNGMTLENPMKIERFIAKRLRSGIFAQILLKLQGAILGTKTQNFFEKKVFLCDPG